MDGSEKGDVEVYSSMDMSVPRGHTGLTRCCPETSGTAESGVAAGGVSEGIAAGGCADWFMPS